MRITVMGAGAVGAYIGARMAVAGHQVGFVARGQHLAAMLERGLEVQSPLGDLRLQPVNASDRPADLGESALVLFTVKAQDTAEAIQAVEPIVGPDTRVLTLQNGVGNVESLTSAFGAERVWGGVAYIEAVVAAPGTIVHKSPFARLVFGGPADQVPRIEGLRDAFTGAGLAAEISQDVQGTIWRKWLLICAFSGMTAVTRQPIGVVLAYPETRSMLRLAMEEIASVAQATDVGLPEDVVDATMRVAEGFQPSMTSSLAQDLAEGKRLESVALNDAASRLGAACGVPTPVNDFIAAALRPYRDGGPPAVSARATGTPQAQAGRPGQVG